MFTSAKHRNNILWQAAISSTMSRPTHSWRITEDFLSNKVEKFNIVTEKKIDNPNANLFE